MARFGRARVSALDGVVIVASVLAYVSSFLPWYRVNVSVSILGIERSGSVNAWNAGIGAWLSVVLLLVAGAVVLAGALGVRLFGWTALIALVLSALSVITILLRWATFPDRRGVLEDQGDLDLGRVFSTSSGADYGLYLGLIAAATAVVASLLAFRAAGGNVDQSRQTPSPTPPPAT